MTRRMPIEADLGAVDRNAPERIVEIDDRAFLDKNAAVERARNAVGADIGADASRQRQVGLVLALAPSRGEHQVLGRYFLCLDIDDAAAALARRHGRANLPRPLVAL